MDHGTIGQEKISAPETEYTVFTVKFNLYFIIADHLVYSWFIYTWLHDRKAFNNSQFVTETMWVRNN